MRRSRDRPAQPPSDRPLWSIVAHAIMVGAVGGVGAWGFRLMIGAVHNLLFLGRFGLAYDANVHTPASPWAAGIILVPVIGAVIVVHLVTHYAPEAKGHGVPEVMDAIHYTSGVIRPVVAAVKALASAVSIGTGGSVGREGPIIQIGAAFGSTVGQLRRLSPADLRLLIAAGAAAGIAATFNAPMGGVLFAVELLLVVVTPRALLVVGAAVVTGVGVARSLLGSALAFTVLDLQQVAPISLDWTQAVALAGLGAGIGAVSAAFIRGLYWSEDRFEGWFRNPYLAHMSGMAAVGVTMYGFFVWLGAYQVQGVGYATITDVMRGVVADPWVLVVLALGKWFATTLTLGSGASGGVFSPSLFMGATLGGAVGHALQVVGLPVDPVLFALGGMAGTIAGTTGAVLTAIAMVTEMTGDFGAVVPLLITAATATAVRAIWSPTTVYTEKLFRRGHPVPQGLQAASVGPVTIAPGPRAE